MTPQEALASIEDRFDQRYNDQAPGWGQLLDAAHQNTQVGRYGTAAGATLLHLTGKLGQGRATAVGTVIGNIWRGINAENRDKRSQTLPLLFMYYGLAILRPQPGSQDHTAMTQMRTELFGRLLPVQMLGDHWVDADHHDESPSVLVTSFALILFSFTENHWQTNQTLNTMAKRLEDHYVKHVSMNQNCKALVIAAVYAYLGKNVTKAFKDEAARYAYTDFDLGARFVHFYEYPDTGGSFARDYFIVPCDVLFPVILKAPNLPMALRLKAVRIQRALIKTVEKHGVFRTDTTSRPSTLEQMFASVSIAAVNAPPPLRWGSIGDWVAWIGYWLRLQRPKRPRWFNWLLRFVYLSYAVTIYLVAVDPTSPSWVPFGLAGCGLCLGALKKPEDLIRELLGTHENI